MIKYVCENFKYGGKTLDCSPIVKVLQGKTLNFTDASILCTKKSSCVIDIHPTMTAGTPQDAQEFYVFLMDKFSGMSKRYRLIDIMNYCLPEYLLLASELKYCRHSTSKSTKKVGPIKYYCTCMCEINQCWYCG